METVPTLVQQNGCMLRRSTYGPASQVRSARPWPSPPGSLRDGPPVCQVDGPTGRRAALLKQTRASHGFKVVRTGFRAQLVLPKRARLEYVVLLRALYLFEVLKENQQSVLFLFFWGGQSPTTSHPGSARVPRRSGGPCQELSPHLPGGGWTLPYFGDAEICLGFSV